MIIEFAFLYLKAFPTKYKLNVFFINHLFSNEPKHEREIENLALIDFENKKAKF
jgi:hypothetical protein